MCSWRRLRLPEWLSTVFQKTLRPNLGKGGGSVPALAKKECDATVGSRRRAQSAGLYAVACEVVVEATAMTSLREGKAGSRVRGDGVGAADGARQFNRARRSRPSDRRTHRRGRRRIRPTAPRHERSCLAPSEPRCCPQFGEVTTASDTTLLRVPGGSWSDGYDSLGSELEDPQRCNWT
jgi:hypothetical protein